VTAQTRTWWLAGRSDNASAPELDPRAGRVQPTSRPVYRVFAADTAAATETASNYWLTAERRKRQEEVLLLIGAL
jgi:hypothetical protein